MAETIGIATGAGASDGMLSEAGVNAPAPIRRSFGYCGECGTWDAHGPRCSCCGYDFHAEPTTEQCDE